MRRPFREHHLLQILSAFEQQTLPLDVFLRNYFREHTAVGSKDRKEICEAIYAMIRWRSLLDYFAQKPLYRAQEGFVNLDSARQSQIEASRSERRIPAPSGQAEKTAGDMRKSSGLSQCDAGERSEPARRDRFGKVAASPNSQNVTKRGITWENRYRVFQRFNPQDAQTDLSIPPHIRVSFPKAFFQLLSDTWGEEKAIEFCLSCNNTAPTTVRVNLLKTTRESLLEQWKGVYKVSACQHAATGICFEEKINFFGTEEFKAGLFEVQDEASQLIAQLIAAKPGERILDYCAGSGGKSLAIAPLLQGKGQLFLHDIRPFALQEAKKRLKRAGIQNAQPLPADSPNKASIKARMDWVLVDAPCSGSGTLRRNPDMKWKFESSMIERLKSEQRQIFEEALTFLKPGGHIVYATCSVLPQENQHQAAYFAERFSLEQVGDAFSSFPVPGAMDGFFGIVFKKKKG